MFDPRVAKLADVIVNYSTAVKKDELVMLGGTLESAPLIVELYRAVLKAGGHPWVRMAPAELGEIALAEASDEQLAYLCPLDRTAISKVDVNIKIWSEQNTKALTGSDPKRQAVASKARRPLMAISMKRSALPAGDPKQLRWAGTLFPTQAHAQDAEMSLREYEEFVYKAGKLDKRNPVAEWIKLGEAQQRLADRLDKAKEMHIRTPDGVDVRFGIEGRRWINCDGKFNFPDGEVFTGPIEDATEGVIQYRFPAVYGGREARDIRLEFKAGKVVDASASANEDFVFQMIDQDKGARILGELALGTNYGIQQHTRNILFDEKIGGTFHCALGMAYPESGGTNKSALHWDMICDLRNGGVVEVDGEVISRNGKFVNRKWPR
ncbi:MAG: aminopeptidase [Planctomycetota bacterium]|jgi:aminopeptidase